MMKYKRILPLLMYFIVNQAIGQSNINTNGNTINNTNGEISYTIGQIVFNQTNDSNYSITFGIQQSYNLKKLSIVTNLNTFNENTIYPNPTNDILFFKLGNRENIQLDIKIYNLQGELIKIENKNSINHYIDIKEFSSGIYLIVISDQANTNNTFKIFKN